MSRQGYRDLILLAGLTLAVRMLTALLLERPGYMDAAYYVDGGLSLYAGRGFNDPFIWNYLDDPAAIPHPSHLYWMPLSSILVYLSFLVWGPTYHAAQVPFALLSSLLPILAYVVAFDVAQNRRHALCAGLFATFSGFYMVYWVTPDNFAPFAVAGALALWAAGQALKTGWPAWLALAGLCAGLAHLARADGLLLAIAIVIAWLVHRVALAGWRAVPWSSLAVGCLAFAASYLVVMGPWMLRNVQQAGHPLPAVGVRTAWLTDYDDLYSYGRSLGLKDYVSWGWANILGSKVRGLWANAQTLLFVGWMIFLAPFGLIGAWCLRRRVEFRAAWLYGVLLYLAMSVVFTFPGWRGGMLHSLTALLPFLYAAAAEGLDVSIAWVARWRRTWQLDQAQRILTPGFVGLAVLLSLALYVRGRDRFVGRHLYEDVTAWMAGHAPSSARVMVNDPPSFYYYGRRECLSIPNADLDTVLQVMARYHAEYLLLDGNYPSLRALYEAPQSDERLILLQTFGQGDQVAYLLRLSSAEALHESTLAWGTWVTSRRSESIQT